MKHSVIAAAQRIIETAADAQVENFVARQLSVAQPNTNIVVTKELILAYRKLFALANTVLAETEASTRKLKLKDLAESIPEMFTEADEMDSKTYVKIMPPLRGAVYQYKRIVKQFRKDKDATQLASDMKDFFLQQFVRARSK